MSIVPLYVPTHVGITYFPHMWPDIQKKRRIITGRQIPPLFVIRLQKNLYLTQQMGHRTDL